MLAYHDNLRLRENALNLARGVQTVHVWHADVHDDDVGTFRPGFPHSIPAVHGLRANGKRGTRCENGANPSPHKFMIIDHQNSRHSSFHTQFLTTQQSSNLRRKNFIQLNSQTIVHA